MKGSVHMNEQAAGQSREVADLEPENRRGRRRPTRKHVVMASVGVTCLAVLGALVVVAAGDPGKSHAADQALYDRTWTNLSSSQATSTASQFAGLALSVSVDCAANKLVGAASPLKSAPQIAGFVVNQAIGGDDPCTVAERTAIAAAALYTLQNQQPTFQLTVNRHDRGIGRVDTCQNTLRVNNISQTFETVRLPTSRCYGE